MARNIGANATEGWRVVLVFDEVGPNGASKRLTEYQGLYNTHAAAKGRQSYWKNWTEYKVRTEKNYGRFLVDSWVERTSLNWERVDD